MYVNIVWNHVKNQKDYKLISTLRLTVKLDNQSKILLFPAGNWVGLKIFFRELIMHQTQKNRNKVNSNKDFTPDFTDLLSGKSGFFLPSTWSISYSWNLAGNVKQVAQSLGISRTTCYRKIKKYQIRTIKKYQIEH